MGCDIHLFVEKNVNGYWHPADEWETEIAEVANGDHKETVTYKSYKSLFYTGRNYDLFAILANVRNGYGFAGVDTGEGYKPMSEPKDLPEDVSEYIAEYSAQWGMDGHSHSHHTLRELLEYDWTQETVKRGLTDLRSWVNWIEREKWLEPGEGPESYCGGVGGGNIEQLTPAAARNILNQAKDEMAKTKGERLYGDKWLDRVEEIFDRYYPNKQIYVQCEWGTPYYASCGHFWATTMPRLLHLADGDIDSVRIVFWFDN